MQLTFLGAAQTVTGSRFLLRTHDHHYLIDCGLFQGGRSLKALNWEPFPIDPKSIEAVFLTHAHIDHTGYLPRLVREGYQGPIYASQATCALLEILLPDAAHLQEQDAAYANKRGYSRHKPALPLFTAEDAQAALAALQPIPFDTLLELEEVNLIWRPAGHILGSAILELTLVSHPEQTKIVFSGDLGRSDDEIMKPPTNIATADILLVESTYGNKSRRDENMLQALAEVVKHAAKHRSVLLIPAFAVGRTQGLLYYLRKLQDQRRIPDLPVFIDSPMAVDVSALYCRFGDDHNLDVNLLMDHSACPLRCEDTNFVKTVEDSKELNVRKGPAVIISASGMCTGGRILHHLKYRLPDEHNVVLFVGYQAEGSRGRQLLDGAEELSIHGEKIKVRARIAQIHGLSAHADQGELWDWLSAFRQPPGKTFIVHGEPAGSRALEEKLSAGWGWNASIPQRGESYVI